jgi:hypothetical protein
MKLRFSGNINIAATKAALAESQMATANRYRRIM